MTYVEIIEKLKTLYDEVDAFAYDEAPYSVDDYPESVEAARKMDGFVLLHRDNKYKWDSPENEAIYKKMPSAWNIAKKLYNEDEHSLIWEEVEQYGGEGKGEDWYSVKYFPKYDIYIRVDGWYQSYNGTEFHSGWDCCKEVRPQQKTITVYK